MKAIRQVGDLKMPPKSKLSPGVVADFEKWINSRYQLVYQSHGNGSGWRSISITPRRRDIEILNARKGYFAE